jgi:hypothetical protein
MFLTNKPQYRCEWCEWSILAAKRWLHTDMFIALMQGMMAAQPAPGQKMCTSGGNICEVIHSVTHTLLS